MGFGTLMVFVTIGITLANHAPFPWGPVGIEVGAVAAVAVAVRGTYVLKLRSEARVARVVEVDAEGYRIGPSRKRWKPLYIKTHLESASLEETGSLLVLHGSWETDADPFVVRVPFPKSERALAESYLAHLRSL